MHAVHTEITEIFLMTKIRSWKKQRNWKKKEEEERAAEEAATKKALKESKLIKQYEATLKEKREKEENKRKTADILFLEATERLKRGIEKNNMEEIQLAQAMLETVTVVRNEESTERKEVDKIQKTLEKRKSSLMQNCISKKPKNNWRDCLNVELSCHTFFYAEIFFHPYHFKYLA